MTESNLEQQYKGYIKALNELRFGDLDQFVAEQVEFRGKTVTTKEYGDAVASFCNACEHGLYFDLIDCVIDSSKERLAAKLIITGKPTKDFYGYKPNGNTIKFGESAFYYFKNGKIVKVDSIVDRGDIQDSLAAKQ